MDRRTRIDLLMRMIRTYGETFDHRAFEGIPVEKLIDQWTEFEEGMKKLRGEYPAPSVT